LRKPEFSPRLLPEPAWGSLVGAALAAGLQWPDILKMAREVFWPGLLNGKRLERFCGEMALRKALRTCNFHSQRLLPQCRTGKP